MDRRRFLKLSIALSAVSQAPSMLAIANAQQKAFAPRSGPWRAYEITTRVEILKPSGVTRVWIPLPVVESEYQKPRGNTWSGNAKVMEQMTDPQFGAGMVYAEWPAAEG